MCLKGQIDVNTYPENGIGYKVFVKLEPNLYKPLYICISDAMYIRDQEYIAFDDMLPDGNGLYYPAGFHIFPDFEGAQNLIKYFRIHLPRRKVVIVRVSYRNRVACGYEQKLGVEHPVIVAKYMTLLEEVSDSAN